MTRGPRGLAGLDPRRKCRGCDKRTPVRRQYLCRTCWFQLPVETRQRLNLRDAQARPRLIELYRSLRDRIPLGSITVTP